MLLVNGDPAAHAFEIPDLGEGFGDVFGPGRAAGPDGLNGEGGRVIRRDGEGIGGRAVPRFIPADEILKLRITVLR